MSLGRVFKYVSRKPHFLKVAVLQFFISRGDVMSSFICSSNLLRVEAMKIEVCSAEDYGRVASLFSPLDHLPPASGVVV